MARLIERPGYALSDHDMMVREFVKHLREIGVRNVKAHISGYETPDKIPQPGGGTRIPDITTNDALVEVETADSIDDSHTRDQWAAFSKHAQENDLRFIIVIPKGKKAAAERRVHEHNVEAMIWPI